MRNTATTSSTRARLRMSMSKINLYNLSRIQSPTSKYRVQNFFKQKWVAKSELRSYHGEHVREKQWQKMFTRRLDSVVPMNAAYLAINNGSIESAGRGAGVSRRVKTKGLLRTPHMLQTFAPLERRLDVAVFRALFASSARQARQFVIHGAVTVNGKPMRYPGYLLNPGDLFQVKPERVMFALGQPKVAEVEKKVAEDDAEQEEESERLEQQNAEEPEDTEDRTPKEILKSLLAQSKAILDNPRESISAKRKQDLRAFTKGIRKLMSKAGRGDVDTMSATAQLETIQEQLRMARETKSQQDEKPAPTGSAEVPTIEDVPAEDTGKEFGLQGARDIQQALEMVRANPVDESKPYATPWTPRDYMSAFAFIPRYLEVNQNICAAVYLRHPVARPGLSEVPSPFPEAASANAFAWYLRRR